jgi:valine dehydrogenase (NAD+)
VTSTSSVQHAFDSGHEQVVVCHDRPSGLRAIIAIHSTALGPALGGTRFYPYADADAAMTDALHLSHGMTYKNALAGLDMGGGKAVIIGDPATDKSEPLLRAYGRFVQSLGGRYVTACDVGTYVQDMDVIARECDFVTGRSEADGGAGDSSVLTSFGVFQGMRAAAAHRWGSPTLSGRRVGVAGVGKVGHLLVEHLLTDGADVAVTDVNQGAIERVRAAHPQVDVVDSTDKLVAADLDVYAPCALGDALTPDVVATLQARIVCGAANNQLTGEDDGGRAVADQLVARDLLYCPDYLVNAGGVIQVADELHGFAFERARARVERIFDTTAEVLALAESELVPPSVAADRLAEQRIDRVVDVRRSWLPGRR